MKLLREIWHKVRAVDSRDDELSFRNAESTNPDDIGVTGSPPLCRNCTRFLYTHYNIGEHCVIARSFARLEKAFELGCYLCRLLYHAEWQPLYSHLRSSRQRKRLGDISPRPETYMCSVYQPEGAETTDLIHIRGTANDRESETQIWLVHLVLLPHEEISMVQTLLAVNSASSVAHLAKLWLKNCETKHSSCCHYQNPPGWKPTRLIYVGKPSEDIPPRLCLSSGIPVDKAYITLSHCWGEVEMFKLVSTNIADLMISLPLSELNNVFRDTIDLVRRLGVDYVWIDSLCIIQDSIEDWNHESAMMGRVYKYSFCNVAATGFGNGSKSFYVQRIPEAIRPEKFFVKIGSSKSKSASKAVTGSYYFLEDIWHAGVTTAPLNQRAWVFQERLLAPRVLHMGSKQVFWECRELEACETFPDGIPTPIRSNFKKELAAIIDVPSNVLDITHQNGKIPTSLEGVDASVEEDHLSSLDMLDLWWNVILPGYNQGRLTRFEDKFIAISGVAKEMHRRIGGEYIAGLWGGRLLEQLVWHVSFWRSSNINFGMGNIKRPQEYQAPSWSWAAINGLVELIQMPNASHLAKIVDYNVIPATESEYGRVTGGYIRICGQLTRATFVKDDDYLRRNWRDNSLLRLKGSSSAEILVSPVLIPDVFVLVVESDGEFSSTHYYPVREAIGSRTFWLLPVCEDETGVLGLVLLLSGSGIRGEYRRVGIFMMTEHEWLQGLKASVSFLDSQEYDIFDAQGYTINIV